MVKRNIYTVKTFHIFMVKTTPRSPARTTMSMVKTIPDFMLRHRLLRYCLASWLVVFLGNSNSMNPNGSGPSPKANLLYGWPGIPLPSRPALVFKGKGLQATYWRRRWEALRTVEPRGAAARWEWRYGRILIYIWFIPLFIIILLPLLLVLLSRLHPLLLLFLPLFCNVNQCM